MRYHAKSRTGCFGCKAGRVKCDEKRPQCGRCRRRGGDCVYANAHTEGSTHNSEDVSQAKGDAASSTPAAQNLSPPLLEFDNFISPNFSAKQVLDLRLMHHYTYATSRSFSSELPKSISETLVVDIPQLAFDHDFLLDTVLFVAMVHLGCTQPQCLSQLPVYLYKQQALRSLRHAVSSPLPDSERAIKCSSVLLATVSLAGDHLITEPGIWTTNWLTLVTGQRNFRSFGSAAPSPQTSSESPSGPTQELPLGQRFPRTVCDIQRALRQQVDGERQEDLDVLHQATNSLTNAISHIASYEHEDWTARQVKSLFFNMSKPQDFLSLVRAENPKALVVFAYYVSLFGLLPKIWLYQGVAEHDVHIIADLLEPKWKEYIAVPQRISRMVELPEIIKVLGDCLTGMEQA